MAMCLEKRRFKNIGLLYGLKEDDSGLWAEVNGTNWSQELSKAEGKDFFSNIEEQTAGDCW